MSEHKIVVIVPTYNEKENIVLLIPEIKKHLPQADILVVDDNSPDKTSMAAKEVGEKYSGVYVLDREAKEGLGKAYVSGFRWALQKGYDLIFEMDADFSHDPAYLPDFVAAAQEHDLVIGSRYITGVNVVNWPLSRLLLSYFGNVAARCIAGLQIRDCTGGFKCFHAHTLRAIDLSKVTSSGYSFQVEVNYYVQEQGLSIHEIPIIFKDRVHGVSKMSTAIIREAVALLWKLRLKKILSFS
ncbi:polyprenol monophosphomannose synthase [Chitinivibrio alkaliphilus]|uniref:Family 2 glycosyl transferase n=1 Tax=Chitinivibrio alkaliphilus ACht1 TaxID=1313304 RepID=U7DA84_9BACT|nr:polyprenol monophosphomannose synthase [Chitinivibrio alkaliphilus]ERP38932.1 family 2 glycosyl transferase [Chitinivibrio alkaliphilus ACht1]